MRSLSLLWIGIVTLLAAGPAGALIMTGGADPVSDANWPAGTLDVANHPSRKSWYEGPPFGGGEWVFQHRGNAAAFNEVIKKFAAIKAPELLVVVHEGPGVNPVATAAERAAAARIDWTFTVWSPESFHHLFNHPGGFFGADQPEFHAELPPPRIDLYVTPGGIQWTDVKLPAGMKVIDERAAAHGYKPADGAVVVAAVYDMLTSKPVAGAELVLAKYEALPEAREGLKVKNADTHHWVELPATAADANGRIEAKNVPAGNYQALVRHPGHASRRLGYVTVGAATYNTFTVRLSPAIQQRGRVTDSAGKPVAGVKVRVDECVALDGRGYPVGRTNEHVTAMSDAAGRFTLDGLPRGQAQITAWADGLHQVDMLKPRTIPAEENEIVITMGGTGTVRGKVSGGGGHVTIWPRGGQKVGTWGGSTQVGADGTFVFEGVPAGDYLISTDAAAPYAKERKGTAVVVRVGQTVSVEQTK